MRTFRALTLTSIGFSAGMAAGAAVVRRAIPSRGDAESDEVGLVAIFDEIELESRATAFRGGSMFAWYGGVALAALGGVSVAAKPGSTAPES